MKRLTALALTLAAATVYASTDLVGLNQEIARLLAAYQTKTTQAEIVFKEIETDAVQTLKVDVRGFYKKVGTTNTFQIDLNPISYDFGNGVNPLVKLKGRVGLDLSKLIPQQDFNQLIPDIEKTISELAGDLAKQYGTAVTVEATVTEKSQDAAGNFTGLKGFLIANIDLAQLPETVSITDVPVKFIRLDIDLALKQGAGLSLQALMNPAYKGFQQDQAGLKDYLDRLLKQDPKLLNQLQGYIQQLDGMAEDLVNK